MARSQVLRSRSSTDFERDSKEIEAQFKSVIFQKTDEAGAVLRADSLGSVEALLQLLKDAGIPVSDAAVGTITRKDVMSASVVAQQEPYLGVVMGFNVKILDEAWEESKAANVPILYSDIIYRLVDDYNEWVKKEKEKMKRKALEKFVWPGKVKVLEGYVFRASKPAIFGVDVLGGKIRKGYRLMNESWRGRRRDQGDTAREGEGGGGQSRRGAGHILR